MGEGKPHFGHLFCLSYNQERFEDFVSRTGTSMYRDRLVSTAILLVLRTSAWLTLDFLLFI